MGDRKKRQLINIEELVVKEDLPQVSSRRVKLPKHVVDAFQLYTVLIDIDSIQHFPESGWKIYGTDIMKPRVGTPVAIFGEQKCGKTWLTAQLAGKVLEHSQIINTSGLGVLYPNDGSTHNTTSIFLDFAGNNAPCNDKFLLDLRCTESLLREILLSIADHFVYVTGKFLRSTQLDLQGLVQDTKGREKNGKRADIRSSHRLVVVHNLIEATTKEFLEHRIEETRKVYIKSTKDSDGNMVADLNSWAPSKTNITIAGLEGEFEVYNTECFTHVFLVNHPQCTLTTCQSPDELWRLQHNMRAFYFINLQLTVITRETASFNLIKEVQQAVTLSLNTFTGNFPKVEREITRPGAEKRPPPPKPVLEVVCLTEDEDQPAMFKVRKPDDVESPSEEFSKTLDEDGYVTTPFELRPIEFMDNRAVSIFTLKGHYIVDPEDPTQFRVRVEVPGVYGKGQIKLRRLALLNQVVLHVSRPPIFPLDVPATDFVEFTYVATFAENNSFLQRGTPEAIIDAAKLEHGFFTFWLPRDLSNSQD